MLNISITEFLTQQIKCPFYESKKPKDQKTIKAQYYDLSDPAGCGNYFHNYIAHSLNPEIHILSQNTSINKEAAETVKWVKDEIGLDNLNVEQLISTHYEDRKGRRWTISGKPDLYKIEDDKIILVDFKHMEETEDTDMLYIVKQIIIYSGMLAEKNDKLQQFTLYVKFLNTYKEMKFERSTLMAIYEEYIKEIKEYINNAEGNPCTKCDKCANVACTALLKGAAELILRVANNSNAGSISKDDICSIMYQLVCFSNLKEYGKKLVPQEQKAQFESNDEAVKIYKEKCHELNIEPTLTVKEESVTSDEFKRVMGEEIHKEFCTKITSKPINDTSKTYCEWD